jgi:PAS domain S-box-containing protein
VTSKPNPSLAGDESAQSRPVVASSDWANSRSKSEAFISPQVAGDVAVDLVCPGSDMTHEHRVTPATLDFALQRGALEEIPFGVATTRGGTVLYANEALTRMYGVAPGTLEQKHVSQLFDPETFRRISRDLNETRIFDGRVHTRVFDREIDAEVHVEWYSSEALGVGGFLVMRDVSIELGALGRLVDQLGGAMFRIRVADGALEYVSPAIAKLTGLGHAECMEHPVLLTKLVSSEERDRLAFLYRRVAKGDVALATAQVSLRRQDGSSRLLHLRATSRRDTGGVVRHIDGVVTDAAREVDPPSGHGHAAHAGRHGDPAGGIATGMMAVAHELLHEASQHLHTLGREVRAMRSLLKAYGASLPPDLLEELGARLDTLALATTGSAAINRGVRKALAAHTMGAPLAEVLDNVRATLLPVLGDRFLKVDVGDAGATVIPERVDELTIALTHLALRAFRFSGSGTLQICASQATAMTPEPRSTMGASPPNPRPRPWLAPPGREPPAFALIEILGNAPADLGGAAVEISSDMLKTIPRPAEADLAYAGAQALITCAGGSIEVDDATFSTARTVVRLRG